MTKQSARQSAREKAAAQREAARRAEMRRRYLMVAAGVIAVAIVATLVLVKVLNGSPAPAKAGGTGTAGVPDATPLPPSILADIASIPAGTLDTIGAGGVPLVTSQGVHDISGPALTSGGKPELLTINSGYCPYCAAMRWPLAVALSRFGRLSPLHGIYSPQGGQIPFPHTATLTFYRTHYSSPYLTFVPIETATTSQAPLQRPTPAQQALWRTYTHGDFPFIDIGNKYLVTIIYSASYLAGQSWSQIAAALHDPSSPIAQGIDGAANYITAAICKQTNGQPATACGSPMIKKLQASF